jgi:hypothetical protein
MNSQERQNRRLSKTYETIYFDETLSPPRVSPVVTFGHWRADAIDRPVENSFRGRPSRMTHTYRQKSTPRRLSTGAHGRVTLPRSYTRQCVRGDQCGLAIARQRMFPAADAWANEVKPARLPRLTRPCSWSESSFSSRNRATTQKPSAKYCNSRTRRSAVLINREARPMSDQYVAHSIGSYPVEERSFVRVA